MAGSVWHIMYFIGSDIPTILFTRTSLPIMLIATSRDATRCHRFMMANLAALLTAIIALRQILLHINEPIGQAYGGRVFGYHLYTWVFIFSVVIIIYNSFMSCFFQQFLHKPLYYQGKLGRYMVIGLMCLLVFVAILNAMGVYLECGLSQCPDNPIIYKTLTFSNSR